MVRRKFVMSKKTRKRHCIDGAKVSNREPKDPSLRQKFADHIEVNTSGLPPKVDLRPYMSPIGEQSAIGSCVGDAFAGRYESFFLRFDKCLLVGAYEYLLKKSDGRDINISRLFIYYNARVKDKKDLNIDEPLHDSGCTNTSALETLKEFGVCEEEIWKHDKKVINKRPSDEAYEAATSRKILDALEVNTDLTEMKTCLAQGYPFVFSLRVFNSFERFYSKGIVPMPTPEEIKQEEPEGHAMLAVGYSDCSKSFIVRNSWGKEWGDEGYAFIPYAYMVNPHYCLEAVAVRQVDSNDLGHDGWNQDDSINYHPDDVDPEDDHEDEFEIIDEDVDDESEGEQEQQEEQEEE
ncbi:unnamed protein product [Rotaria sp. Silwood1]|nr:unnamed protein product [Rotaria sp. Silwood1]